MNPSKSHLKALVAGEFGRQILELEMRAKKLVFKQEGGVEFLKNAAKKVGGLAEIVDKDREPGAFDEPGDPLTVDRLIKRYLQRAVGILDNLATQAQVGHYMAMGQERGLTDANAIVHKAWETERAKLEAYLAAEGDGPPADGEPPTAVPGNGAPPPAAPAGHPGPSLKARRQAEAAAEAAPAAKSNGKRSTAAKGRRKATTPTERARGRAKPKAKPRAPAKKRASSKENGADGRNPE